jgi:DNA replication and repair protein RecF
VAIDSLALHQFRSHGASRYHFHPQITLITGPNGSGKTSILEAIYLLGTGRSFKASDQELVAFGEQWWRVGATVNGGEREIRYDMSGEKPKKEILIEGTKKGRFTRTYFVPMVLFDPDDLLLVHGSPSRRRRYVDVLLARIDPHYARAIKMYERSLLQRNNLLKRGGDIDDTLFVWDISLAEHAATIITARMAFLDAIHDDVERYYKDIAGTDEVAHITYHASADYALADLSSSIIAQLRARHARDKLTGFTSVGPHRDDVLFMLRDRTAESTASRGEIRTMILALKLAETSYIKSVYGADPVILFDDVFSELDAQRRGTLVKDLFVDNQIILTTTDVTVDLGSRDLQHITLT